MSILRASRPGAERRRAVRGALPGLGAALLLAAAAWLATPAAWAQAATTAAPKLLRVVFPAAETGFDPAQVVDIYSRTVTAHVFESLYGYDPLARPYRIVPRTAAAMPEVSEDFKTWTVRIRPGIHFADDPAFKGPDGRPVRRELTAADYVYSFKRFFDPATKSPLYSSLREEGFIGLQTLREEAEKSKQPFDYDRDIEGLRALDRYTLQFKLDKPRPRLLYTLASGDIYGAVAREVVEAYGADIMAHPVGTGPYVLRQWRRSSLIVLERNPGYREVLYDAAPAADDAEGQALLAAYRGRRLPLNDRVEISIIDENQPRWLAFLNSQLDIATVPLDFASQAAPNGELAPNLAKQGIRMQRIVNPDATMTFFNMEDPLIGGYTPEKVALRRAISLAADIEREIQTVRRGQAITAQAMLPPHTYGYEAAFRSEAGLHDPARAKALLDLYGYTDRDGDGWREQPDGSPLTLRLATQPDQISRQFDELWKKNMNAVGLRLAFDFGQWPEQLKGARAGTLMMWMVGSTAASPDSQPALERLFGPAAGGQNLSRFRHDAYDRLYRRIGELPDGPERLALIRDAVRIGLVYAPYKYHVHRIVTDLSQPWVSGFRRPLFWLEQWTHVDIDTARRPPPR